MKTVFADTFYWVAIANPRDQWHESARRVSQSLEQTRLVTTDEVLVEFLTLLSSYGAEMRNTAVRLTLEEVWSRIQHLSAETGHKKIVLRPKQEKLLNLLRDHTSLTPRQIWELLNISKQGAIDLLNPLIEAGMVKRIGTRKSGKYLLA